MIYLIGGPPRCGKTTLAKELSKKIKIPWISADTLEVVSREYTDKKERKNLYPYSFLRKKGGKRNNDEFYSEHSPQKIINILKRQAKTSFKAIDMMIANEIDNGNDYIIEGYHIMPIFAQKIIKKYGSSNIKIIFLTKFDKEKFASDVAKSATPNDWLIVSTHDKKTFIKVGEMVSVFSSYFAREAKKFKFIVLNMDNKFESQIKNAIKILKYPI